MSRGPLEQNDTVRRWMDNDMDITMVACSLF